ncbi:hypothetical protein GDO81_026792 [Engystomops pustulosus]|uniref:Uncharacterized protein n=1 Tax=Engystomops pustulosus TaxID=76066 RepID=A0AAV6YR48_ENGPU|nr:hypothetical protein GDO81_026792 [Engystomops pustulosus]
MQCVMRIPGYSAAPRLCYICTELIQKRPGRNIQLQTSTRRMMHHQRGRHCMQEGGDCTVQGVTRGGATACRRMVTAQYRV